MPGAIGSVGANDSRKGSGIATGSGGLVIMAAASSPIGASMLGGR